MKTGFLRNRSPVYTEIARGKSNGFFLVTGFLLSALIFYYDTIAPLGVSVGILLFFPLLFFLQVKHRNTYIYSPLFISFVDIIGFFFSPSIGLPGHVVFFNRALPVTLFWTLAFLVKRSDTIDEKLIASEREFRTLAENAPDIIARFDRELRYVYVNSSAERSYGISREAFIGRTIRETGMHSETADFFESALREVYETGKQKIIEYEFIGLDGRKRCHFTIIVPEYDESGNIPSILTVTHDITQLKETEKRLSEATREAGKRAEEAEEGKRIFEAIMDNIPQGLIVADSESRIRSVSRYVADFAGTTREKMENISVEEYINLLNKTHLDGVTVAAPSEVAVFRAVDAGEHVVDEEWIVKNKRGEWKYLIVDASPIMDEKGVIIGGVGAWRDITERKRIEETLQLYKLISDITRDIVLYMGRDGMILEANRAAEKAYMYSREELLKKNIQNLRAPDTRDITEEQMRQAETKGILFETVHMRSDGSTFPVEVSSRGAEIGGKRVLISTIRDITERKEAEAVLHESEQRFRQLADSMPQLVWTAEPDGRVDYYNSRYMEYDGIDPLTEDRYEWAPVLHPDDLEKTVNAWQHSIATGEIYQVEHRVLMQDGSLRWHLSRGLPVRDADGNIVKWYGTATDIDDTVKVREALAENENRLKTIIENIPEGLIVIDPEGNTLHWNRRALEMHGYERHEEELSFFNNLTDVFELSTLDGRVLPLQEWLVPRLMRGEIFSNLELLVKNRKTGWQRIFSSTGITIYDKEGNLSMAILSIRDVTELREAEEILRKSREDLNLAQLVSHTGSWRLDIVGNELHWSDEAYRIFGVELGTPMTYNNFLSFVHPDDRSYVDTKWRTAMEGGEYDIEHRILAEGKTKWVRQKAYLELDSRGALIGAFGTIQDVSDRKEIEENLRRNEYELRTLADNSPDLIFRMGRNMRYLYANNSYERLTGIPKEKFSGKTNHELGMSSEFVEFWMKSVERVINNGREYSVEFEMPGLFGKRFFLASLIPEFERTGLVNTILVIARDITERKKAEEHIRYISFHDEVTGLYNRAFFEEEIQRIDNPRDLPLSIIIGDVNYLKLTNDAFGHNEGDRLLRAVGAIISSSCRENDIVARWGGDEFAVILPKTHFRITQHICARINKAADKYKDSVITPQIALGIATKDNPRQSMHKIIREAEERMYQNKIEGSKQSQEKILESLFNRLEEMIPDFKQHIERNKKNVRGFGKELNLNKSQLNDLELLMQYHDIGKVAIPEYIFSKSGKLTDEEWEIMKKHSDIGFRIVKVFPDTARIAEEVLAHGERWDGTGYPRNLKESEIPCLARIFAVLDVWDVITHERPYAPVFTDDEAIEEMERNSGKQFDPEILEKFIQFIRKENVLKMP